MQVAKFWKEVESGIQCCLCSHFCKLSNDETGKCSVRKNIDGQLFSLVGDKIVSYNMDPIEKKPLYHFLPGSAIFSMGSMGCNLDCAWCQNTGIAHPLNERDALKGQKIDPKLIIETCKKHDCKSIAYTYNEPTVFFELMEKCAKLAKDNEINNIIVSNAYQSPESLRALLPYLNAANIDLKCFKDSSYQKFCNAKIKPILNNIKTISKSTWLEITTLVVPTVNDDLSELKDLAKFIVHEVGTETPWHLSAFRPCRKMMNIPQTEPKILLEAAEIGREIGLKYVYVNNVQKMNKTACPNCQEVLIQRKGYYTEINKNFVNGTCPSCQNKISGMWC